MFAARRRGAAEVSGLDQSLPGAAGAELGGRARRARVEVADADRADPEHLRRAVPDLLKRLVAHVAAGDRHRDARHHVSVRADVAGVVGGAAGDRVEIRADGWDPGRSRPSEIGVQRWILEDRLEILPGDSERDGRHVSIVLRGDHRVEAAPDPETLGECADLFILRHVLLHERAVEPDGNSGVAE